MTSAQRFVDQDARDAIEQDLDHTLFVEAGAGTGKTTSLVARIVSLLGTGRVGPANIAAITFTEKAAAELRDRVRTALDERVAGSETTDDARECFQKALDELDSAAIETIHAFCRRILAAHPIQAGLPPGFEVLDESEANALFHEQWDEWFEGLLQRANSDPALATPLARSIWLGVGPEKLRALASDLRGQWDRLSADPPRVEQPEIDLDPIADALDEALPYRSMCNDASDILFQHLERMADLPARLRGVADDMDAVLLLRYMPKLSTSGGKQSTWDGVTPGEVRDLLKKAQARREDLGQVVGSAATSALLAESCRFVHAAAAARRAEGTIEFQDLLTLARNLLASDDGVRRELRRRFTHVLIDEFQDTDPLQAELAVLLGSEPSDAGNHDWLDLPVDGGRLFFVGDPKQSIYRFRRADIDLYMRVRERFQGGLKRLTQNFRSVPGVIDWVNGQFGERFEQTVEPGDEAVAKQAPFEQLAAERGSLDSSPSVQHIGGAIDSNVDQVRVEEANEIVALLRDVSAGNWKVGGEAGATRVARLQDVAILSRSRTGLRVIIQALEDNAIPHRVESRTLVFDAQEVRDLVSILRAIDDPTDEVAVVAALRSPAFACADDDLVKWHAAGGGWDYLQGRPSESEADSPIGEAMAWLREKHEVRWLAPLAALVDDVLRERRLFELAFVDRRPRERWQRLRFVAEQARAYAERPEATLRGLIEWLQWQAEEGAQVQEHVVPEPDDDAVRIMTIHAAKGLEFPIVVLAGLNSTRSGGQAAALLWDPDGAPQANLGGDLVTGGYKAAQTFDKEHDRLESDRLLYVAMTRARDHLVLSLFHKKAGSTSQPTRAQQILEFAQRRSDLCPELRVNRAPRGSEPAAQAVSALEAPGDREKWIAEREAFASAQRVRHSISATELAKEQAERTGGGDAAQDDGLEKDAPDVERPPWRRGRAGTAIGRAVHSVLQTIDLATGDDLAAVAAAQAAAEGVADRADEVARLARAALESATVRTAVAGGRYWREVYVASEIDGVVLDGFIDLLYEGNEGYVVVDYKTDSIGSRSVDEVLARYRPQGLAYALALGARLPKPVTRCEFIFVGSPGGAVTRAVEVSDTALRELRTSVAQLAR